MTFQQLAETSDGCNFEPVVVADCFRVFGELGCFEICERFQDRQVVFVSLEQSLLMSAHLDHVLAQFHVGRLFCIVCADSVVWQDVTIDLT